jgi:triosephosphate isomerase
MSERPRLVLCLNLKTYLSHEQACIWCTQIADLAHSHWAVLGGAVELVVLPSVTALLDARRIFELTSVSLGAQDLFWAEAGPYSGEIGGDLLRELGCRYAQVGHAERRVLLGEDDEIAARKTAAALRNGLVPIVCVGERTPVTTHAAADHCVRQLDSALSQARAAGQLAPVVVAYEPVWAIGHGQPAAAEHSAAVCQALRRHVDSDPLLAGSRVVYGGGAGPRLLPQLVPSVDGIVLERSAPDLDALRTILDEAAVLLHPART